MRYEYDAAWTSGLKEKKDMRKYKEIVAEALEAEKKLQWGRAGELWDEAKLAARAQKRSSAEATTAAMAARQKAGAASPPAPEPTPAQLAEAGEGQKYVEKREKADRRKKDRRKPKAEGVVASREAREAARGAGLAERETKRAEQNGLKLGQVLRHTRQGKVVAECVYVAPRRWTVDGVEYSSISTAANKTAEKLGMKARNLSGWTFWGVERREDER